MPTQVPSAGLPIDPVLKRFLKVLFASIVTAAIGSTVIFLQQNPTIAFQFGVFTITGGMISAALLAIEKSFASNL